MRKITDYLQLKGGYPIVARVVLSSIDYTTTNTRITVDNLKWITARCWTSFLLYFVLVNNISLLISWTLRSRSEGSNSKCSAPIHSIHSSGSLPAPGNWLCVSVVLLGMIIVFIRLLASIHSNILQFQENTSTPSSSPSEDYTPQPMGTRGAKPKAKKATQKKPGGRGRRRTTYQDISEEDKRRLKELHKERIAEAEVCLWIVIIQV